MDGDRAPWLFDPSATRALVLAHRSPGGRPVEDVVSDVVWGDVVRLLRWAAAAASAPPGLRAGTWWRLAAGCAALLRRMPALSAEIDQPWSVRPPEPAVAGVHPAQRIDEVAARLTALLRSERPVALRVLAPEVDALGEAAVQAIAASSFHSLHPDM
jgi:hypothetical protein